MSDDLPYLLLNVFKIIVAILVIFELIKSILCIKKNPKTETE
jgi:hypothetical protein